MNGSLQTLEPPAHAPATNTLSEALTHFDRTAVRLGLDSGTTQLLRAPLREYRVMVPVRMDDGTTGVLTCSYFEQVQGQSNYYWNAHDVVQKVDARMTSAFTAVHERAEREPVALRDAAYLIAVERVAHACRERGWV